MGEACITMACGAAGPLGFLRTTVLVQVLLGPALLVPWLLAYPPQQHRVMASAPAAAAAGAPSHELVLTAGGAAFLDGQRTNGWAELRSALERIRALEPGATVHFRPAPEARYEDFLELLTLIKWARLDKVGIDDARYAAALDESYDEGRRERRSGDPSPEG